MRRYAARGCRRGSQRWPREVLVEGELGLVGPLAPQLGAARGLDVLELEQGLGEPGPGAPGRPLAVAGLPGSSVPAGPAHGGAGSAQEPRALGPWHLLGKVVAGTPPGLRCPCEAECGAVVRKVRESPLRRGR